MSSRIPAEKTVGLIRTRFYQPSLPSDYVARPSVIERLNHELAKPLTLVSAPAGYGKSILVSAWMARCPRPSTWLSIDESLNDFGVFLAYFVGAIEEIAPSALERTRTMMAGFALPSLDVIANSLINELDEIDKPFVVVLEDYHAIHTSEIHELLAVLLRHPLPHIHLVIVTRQDPPLSIGRMRAHDLVSEVRVQDLRFSAAETQEFLEKILDSLLTQAVLDDLIAKTEGWVAGLRLMALTLRYMPDSASRLTALRGVEHDRYLADYLVSEVVAKLPPKQADFLLRTSILDRLCASLSVALLGSDANAEGCQLTLEWLEQNNVFTTSLDLDGQWFRYHPLFQSILQGQLGRTQDSQKVAQLHRRAGAWYAEHGLLEESLRHALLGNDMKGAVDLLAANRHRLMNEEKWQALERMLRVLPADVVAADLELTLAEAWLARLTRVDLAPVLGLLERAERLLEQMADRPERATHLAGEIDCLRITVLVETSSEPEAVIALGHRALATTPRAWYFVRAVAWLWLALAYQMAGKLDTAHAMLSEGQVEDVASDGTVRARIAGSRAFLAWIAGDLRALRLSADHLTTVGETYRQAESMGWGHLLLSSVAYEHNDLASAEVHARAAEDIRYICTPIAYLQSAFVYASIYQARGLQELAQKKVQLAFEFLKETRNENLTLFTAAFQMELAVRQGDLSAASHWAATVGPYIPLTLMPYFYAPQLTLPKILLAQRTPASLEQAAAVLSRLYESVTTNHNTYFTVAVLALESLRHHAQGDEAKAHEVLLESVTLAQPGEFIRMFVDLGPEMALLLGRLQASGAVRAYIEAILRAFAVDQVARRSVPAAAPDLPAALVEPLTRREQEILTLLAQRLTSGEIADRLVVAEQTVKRHRANIYQKLGVNSRREAIDAARALSLIPPG